MTIGQGDLFDVQESYVMLFDRSRTLSLNLIRTWSTGESRDRGRATMGQPDREPTGGRVRSRHPRNCPDHMPVLLEFLASRPFVEAQGNLGGRCPYPRCGLPPVMARRGKRV